MGAILETTRAYQLELTEAALTSNITIVLDTGSGKTHIAARVLTHYESYELQRRDDGIGPRQISFFLVPTVMLVEQQTEYVGRCLRKTPMPICGAMNNINRWDRETWRQLFENNTAIICTGEILNQALAKRYVTIPEINIIIFDEAHHAKAGHPYAVVMKRYKECSEASRPRILGLTASPVESTDRIEKDLATLEKLMDAKVTTSSHASLFQHAHRPREEEWEYFGVRPSRSTELGLQLAHHTQVDALNKIRNSAARTLAELGPWCADRIWQYATEDVQLPKLRQKIEGDDQEEPRPREQVNEELRLLMSALAIIKSYDFDAQVQDVRKVLSGKIMVLHKHLSKQFREDCTARCIVFVRERSMARALFDVFRDLLPVPGMIPTYLVGMGGTEIGDATNSWNQQKETMKRFRTGLVNCIFATQVAEEGVDIPACNLVVRFNPYADIIQYVQSRGRARMRDSIYAVMTDRADQHTTANCQHIRECEQWLQRYYANLSPDRLVELRETSVRAQLASKYGDQYFETFMGARCDLDNALTILEHYANSLQYEQIATNRLRWIELPDKKFMYAVEVPLDTSKAVYPGQPFSSEQEFTQYLENLQTNGSTKIMCVRGLEIYQKGFAKRSAALEACRRLRAVALLDDNLDTVHKRKLEAMDHVAAPSLEKQLQFAVKVRADFWSRDLGADRDTLFAIVLSVTPLFESALEYSPLVLLTRQALPNISPFPLILEKDEEVVVRATHIAIPVQVDSYDLDLLTAFTLDGVYLDVFNKHYEKNVSKMQYWLAPATSARPSSGKFEDIVDLAQLGAMKKGHILWNSSTPNPDLWANKFLVSSGELGRWTYFAGDIVSGSSIGSSVPETALQVPNKSKETVFQFTASASTKWKEYRHPIDPDQPVLYAVMASFRRDFRVAASKEESIRQSAACHVCPQPLKISPLTKGYARTALLFPSMWCHINDRLIADEVCARLNLAVPTDLAVEAITYVVENETNFAEYDMEIQKWPNRNYERLEFYGDTFLKVAIVFILFIKLDRETARNYHVKKKELISNHNLSTVVRRLGLDRYMRSGQVERREFWPANLIQLSGKKARREADDGTVMRSLHQKSIADVAEALIGATLVADFNKRGRFDQALSAVSQLVQSDYHDIYTWDTYRSLYKPPIWQTSSEALASTIEDANNIGEILGYTFKHPNLVRSALTHASYASRSAMVPNYERLEILGDGLYDMTVADFLFHKYPNRGPQYLTEHKDVMVSNKFMAHLCVKLGLHRYIYYASSAATVARCNSYVDQYRDAVDQDRPAQNPNFWYDLEAEPKMFADVVESLVGAMFIDSDFDFGVVERFFNTHVRPCFDNEVLHSEVAHAHPMTVLVHMLKRRFRCVGFGAHTNILDSTNNIAADSSTSADPNTAAAAAPTSIDPRIVTAIRSSPQVHVTLQIHAVTLSTSTAQSGKVAKSRAARAGTTILRAIAARGYGAAKKEFTERFGCGCKWGGTAGLAGWEEEAEGEGGEDLSEVLRDGRIEGG